MWADFVWRWTHGFLPPRTRRRHGGAAMGLQRVVIPGSFLGLFVRTIRPFQEHPSGWDGGAANARTCLLFGAEEMAPVSTDLRVLFAETKLGRKGAGQEPVISQVRGRARKRSDGIPGPPTSTNHQFFWVRCKQGGGFGGRFDAPEKKLLVRRCDHR